MLTLVAVVVAWMKGGHPERLAAVVILTSFSVSFITHEWKVGDFYAGDAVVDVLLTAVFVWMAVTRDRWWPLVMSAIMGLTLLVYVASLTVPGVGPYAAISARIGFGILTALTLIAGAGERWLAGERAVSRQAFGARRTRDLNI